MSIQVAIEEALLNIWKDNLARIQWKNEVGSPSLLLFLVMAIKKANLCRQESLSIFQEIEMRFRDLFQETIVHQ